MLRASALRLGVPSGSTEQTFRPFGVLENTADCLPKSSPDLEVIVMIRIRVTVKTKLSIRTVRRTQMLQNFRFMPYSLQQTLNDTNYLEQSHSPLPAEELREQQEETEE